MTTISTEKWDWIHYQIKLAREAHAVGNDTLAHGIMGRLLKSYGRRRDVVGSNVRVAAYHVGLITDGE